MKIWKKAALSMAVVVGGVLSYQVSQSNESCENEAVCTKMRHFRSQLLLLGAQRDHMQVNFTFLRAIAQSMEAQIRQLLTINNFSSHIERIGPVRDLALDLALQADKESPEALVTANKLRRNCTECHSNPSPSDNFNWNDVSRTTWANITGKCNEPNRNPYICKHMYAMVTAFQYFGTAKDVSPGDELFIEAEENAKDIMRLARNLQALKHHHFNYSFKQIEKKAEELVTLAQIKSQEVFIKGQLMTQSCFQCHK